MIKRATFHDGPALFEHVRDSFYRSTLQYGPFDAADAMATVCDALTDGVVFVHPHGSIGLVRHKMLFTARDCLESAWWYSDGAQPMLGAKLIAEAVAYAKTIDIPLIAGIASAANLEKEARLFERYGFRPMGGRYVAGV